ncbi:MAG: phage Gp37/Gp68 family protein [Bryobacteraceae bacterium]
MGKTKIGWTEHVWNPIRGCSKVSEGCKHCYAERMAARFCGKGEPYHGLIDPVTRSWTGRVELIESKLDEPLHRRIPTTYFVNSMSDLFHPSLTFEQIRQVWCGMTALSARHHTYIILTKRYERMADFFNYLHSKIWHEYGVDATETEGIPDVLHLPQPHIWLGHSYSNQRDADLGYGHLVNTPARIRFLSLEPLLGEIDLDSLLPGGLTRGKGGWCTGPDWVIAGGESGPDARPMHPDWVMALRDQCAGAGVPFWFKQWGSFGYWDQMPDESVRILDAAGELASDKPYYVGKKLAGDFLDGKQYKQRPEGW